MFHVQSICEIESKNVCEKEREKHKVDERSELFFFSKRNICKADKTTQQQIAACEFFNVVVDKHLWFIIDVKVEWKFQK